MLKNYLPLGDSRLTRAAPVQRPRPGGAGRVRLDSPAVMTMTDFRQIEPVTIRSDESIEAANALMIERGVRLLLVVDSDGTTVGFISAADVLGEKPLQFATERGIKRDEIQVVDIMTRYDDMKVLPLSDVLRARVGDIVATLKEFGRQHAIVSEDEGDDHSVRGVFSASQIARQLGVPVHIGEVARTFSEIEATVGKA